jgi:acyl-CoA synthetase (AMP-forming)/AMP-acid ligase II
VTGSAGTLAGAVRQASEQQPNAVAVVDDIGAVTFAELNRRISATVAVVDGLLDAMVPVAVIGPNHRTWIELYYAVPASGRLLVFLNHRLHAQELATMLDRSGAGIVVGNESDLGRLREIGVEVPMFDWTAWSAFVDSEENEGIDRRIDPESAAWLLFTSGTTAAPKGALLSHKGLLASVAASTAARPVSTDDVYIFPFPLCHVAGYNVIHRHAHGRPVVLMPGFAAAEFCETVERERVTSTSLAATMLASLVELLEVEPERIAQLRSLTSIAYGAAPMPTSLLRRTDALLGVDFAQGYGMTELSGNAVFLNAAAHRRGLEGEEGLLEAAGSPVAGVEVRLVDDEDSSVADGEAGEILIRAEQLMVGYLDDEDATSAALRNGWLHTGDIGRMTDGLLYVVDRKKDIIITGGENVSSLEVEASVLDYRDVARVAVVGVPDATWGENVCAVVVAVPGVKLDPVALVAHVRQSLAGFKVPRHVVVADELPVTASGKVRKADLRRWLLENPELLGKRL